MKYALRETNEILQTEADVRQRLQNVSLPAVLTPEMLDAFGICVVNPTEPPATSIIQVADECAPKADETGKLWQDWLIKDIRDGMNNEELTVLLAKVIDNKSLEINAIRDNLLTNGFSYNFPGVGVKVLQTRDEIDMINWLGLQTEAALAALEGRDQDTVGIIADDNSIMTVTFAACVDIMRQMAAWRGAIINRARRLKDSLNTAIIGVESPRTAIDIVMAIDINQGWPS